MKKTYSYYMTQRPPIPGAMPTEGLEFIDENTKLRFINEIGRDAYARLTYNRELTDKEIKDYELIPLFYDVQLTRTEILRIMELLKAKAIEDYTLAEPLGKTHRKLRETLEG